jgi:tetratricopeptide (TPR) repeat protein
MKFALALVMVAYFAGQFLSCASTSYDRYWRGKDLMHAKDYAAALAEFEKGLEADPDSPLLTFEKGRALYALERWAEAKAVFTRFLELTDEKKSTYADERWDAEFCLKKCAQNLGEDAGEADEDDSRFDEGNGDTLGGITMKTR